MAASHRKVMPDYPVFSFSRISNENLLLVESSWQTQLKAFSSSE
jgi:hypothetical protein